MLKVDIEYFKSILNYIYIFICVHVTSRRDIQNVGNMKELDTSFIASQHFSCRARRPNYVENGISERKERGGGAAAAEEEIFV